MVQRSIRVSAWLPAACALLGALALQASTVQSEKFQIPFEFQVQHKTLPAGQYQVQQATGSDLAFLVNSKTGERVEFFRPSTTHKEGKTRLVFENTENGHALKQIS
jgi:hypothetical protein